MVCASLIRSPALSRLLCAGLTVLGLGAGCSPDLPDGDLRDRTLQSNADLDWRDQVIYQVIVDRFDNGDQNNDYNVEPTYPSRYHGGDWRGLRNRLDYLEELGVTTLWISPVVKNVEEDAGFASYHGYWTQDPVRVNPHFGDLLELRALVDDAHARGMYVVLDIVLNHVGQLFFYDMNGNGRADQTLIGGGDSHTCLRICDQPGGDQICSEDERTYCANAGDQLENISEFDPEYDPRGIQGFSATGFSGPADVVFFDRPGETRALPSRPPSFFGWPEDRPWFDSPDWYSRRGRVYTNFREADYSFDFVREQETTGDFTGGLKDLDTDNPDVREALIRSYLYWVEVADFDGFRIDTIKHMDRPELDVNQRGFIGEFSTRVRERLAELGKQNFFMFGEALDGNDELVGLYTLGGADSDGAFGRADSMFQFPAKFRVIDEVFKRGGPTRNIECLLNARLGIAPATPEDTFCADNGFPAGPTWGATAHAASEDGGIGLAPNQVAVNFIDNHDVARFLFDEPSVPALHSALFFLLTWDGVPCLYYGTEQQFDGGNDPKNRQDMFVGNPVTGFAPFDTTNETFVFIRDLIALRNQSAPLRRGTTAVRWSTNRPAGSRDYGLFAFERAADGESVVVVVNTADQDSETCAPAEDGGDCMAVPFAPGTVLRDLAPGSDGATFTVAADGTVAVEVAARGGRVLAP